MATFAVSGPSRRCSIVVNRELDGMKPVHVKVDRDRCFGYGRCADLVPEVFVLDDEGKSVPADPTGVDPSRLAMAAWACPMQAIRLLDENGEEVPPG